LFNGVPAGSASASALSGSASASDAEKLVGLVTGMSLSLLFALFLLVYMRLIRDFDPVEMFGLRQHTLGRTAMFAVIGLAIAYACVLVVNAIAMLLLDGVWPDIGAQEPVQAFQQAGSLPFKIILGLYAAVVAPLVEEIMFRGFLYGVIKRFTDSYFAGLVTALLFGVVHMHVASFAPLCTLGLVLVVAYEVTGSLLVPIGIHALFNTVNLVLMIAGPEGPK
jgi:membrane protease YdiL (CAAX protease family)